MKPEIPVEVPVWHKCNLTLYEASQYFNIGQNYLKKVSASPNCEFVLWVGTRRLIKRKKFEEFLEREYSI